MVVESVLYAPVILIGILLFMFGAKLPPAFRTSSWFVYVGLIVFPFLVWRNFRRGTATATKDAAITESVQTALTGTITSRPQNGGQDYIAGQEKQLEADTRTTKRCPFCAEEILAIAIKCKHCGSNLAGASTVPVEAKSTADFGWALLGVPLAGTLVIWTWVSSLAMIQGPGGATTFIVAAVVIGTAALAAIEAAKLGMKANKLEGTYSPTQWMFLCLFMWVIGYPAYLFKRRHYGRSNLLVPGIAVIVVFLGTVAIIVSAINDKMTEIQTSLSKLQMPEISHLQEASKVHQDLQVAAEPSNPPVPDAQLEPKEGDLSLVKKSDPKAALKMDAHCKTVARSAGGSYVIEEGCRMMEIEAWKHLVLDKEFPTLDEQLLRRCTAGPFNESFVLEEECIKMEIDAKASMRSP